MKRDEARIFLSYTYKDEKEVMKLYRRLKKFGYNPWIDSEDILGSERWEKVIEREIEKAVLFLPCLTHNSITHQGVIQKEINFALNIWHKKLEDDIYLIPVRLEDCDLPGRLRKFHFINLFKENGFQHLVNSLDLAFERLEVIPHIRLRSEPIENLGEDEVKEMLRMNDFYEIEWHDAGKGVQHEYELKAIGNDKIIVDRMTGLTWQQGGSPAQRLYGGVEEYIAELNERRFADFSDWRLPTLEETMSLMEPRQDKNTGLYINSLFDSTQRWIWTSDLYSASAAWYVYFGGALCYGVDLGGYGYARAVRSVIP